MYTIKAQTVVLALVCGLLVTMGMNTWVSDAPLPHGVFTGSDFAHYCEATDAVRQGLSAPRAHHRSWLASQLPGHLAGSYGILDGLAITAFISTVITVGALFLWGWVLGGPLAAVLSAVSVVAFSPLVVLTRHLTFYPQMAAVISLTAWTTAWLIERRTLGRLALATTVAAIAGLIHMQGFFFVIPALVLVCAIALWASSIKTVATRVGVVMLIIGLSGFMGKNAYPTPGYRNSIESEVFRFVQTLNNPLRTLGSSLPPIDECAYPPQEGFSWAKPDPVQLFRAIGCMNQLRQQAEERLEQAPDSKTVKSYRAHRDPWMKPLGVGLLIVVVGLWRRPTALAGALVTLIPYGLYLHYGLVDGTIRRLTIGFLAAPIIVGMAGATLGHLLHRIVGAKWATRVSWTLTGVWALLVFGALPSPVHPDASWRESIPAVNALSESASWKHSALDDQQLCHQALQSDAEKGVPLLGRLGNEYARRHSQD